MSSPWPREQQLRLSTVLMDCVEQLTALGRIMLHSGRACPAAGPPSEVSTAARVCGIPRQFVAQVISDVAEELRESGTFHTLLETVGRERKKAAHLQDLIRREEEGRGKMKALQRQLLDIRKEKALELQREEMIAHLKDQLQQMKAKTTLEKKYVKNSSELMVYQGQKFNAHKEKQLEDDIKHLQEKIKEEKRVHKEMEGFLKEHQTQLVQKLEMWMERYDTETDIKALPPCKQTASVFQYQESEQVVITDRLEKEEQRRLQEKEERERKAAVKIQAWWRGTCVRQGLGPYGKGTKGPKGSKGSKDKKTKEAKKEKKK
uniref:Dynein regulatory complex protein 9 n=1 Tax=Scleropages formosus TaxID=113540 RepID=A0A8C9S1F8_SCLFO